MVNKLLANISFSPSLVEQLGFYSRRLKREQSVRRLGLVMIILSMFVQIFAVNFPAEKSLAYSDNHIINGVKSRNDILRAWDDPSSDVARIYSKFGVSRKDIANLSKRPNDTIASNANNFWSIGRNSLSGYSNISGNYKDQEIAINTEGPTVYLRPLRAWDTASGYSNYAAFKGKNSTTGENFWILVDCGNYTQIGKGRPPKPELEIKKTIVGNPSKVKAGDTIKFRIEYRNKKQDSLAEDVMLIDKLERKKFEVLSPNNLPIGSDDTMERGVGNLQFTRHSRVFDIEVRLKQNLKTNTDICNKVRLTSSNADTASDEVCVPVKSPPKPEPNPGPTPTPIPDTPPDETPPPPVPPNQIPPGFSKRVSNISRKLSTEKTMETPVRGGDVIEYTLITTNSRDSEITGFTVADYVGDIVEYSNLDLEFLAKQGGSYNKSTKQVVWAGASLPASSDVTKKFRVTIKNPIPSTNTPSNVTTSFDCKISNEYGDEISMDVVCPALKTVETLPNTGPGATIGFAFATTMVSSYFFARSRLLAKELVVAKHNFLSSGSV